MAKIIHAGGAQVSGSIGATTYTRNGIARRRSNPTNPNTTAQQAVRANLATLAGNWKDLTGPQKLSWSSMGMTRTNSLGQTVMLTGFQAYQAINGLRLALAAAALTTAPALLPPPTGPGVIMGIPVMVGATTLSIPFPNGDAEHMLIYAGAPQSAGRAYDRNLRLIGEFILADGATDPDDTYDAYVATWGTPPSGSKLFFEAKGYQDGQTYAAGGNTCIVPPA